MSVPFQPQLRSAPLRRRGMLSGAAALAAYGALSKGARGASLPPPNLRNMPNTVTASVGHRTSSSNVGQSTGNSLNQWFAAKCVLTMGPQAACDLRLHFSNTVDLYTGDVSNANAIVIGAGIEYPAGSGIVTPTTFGGLATVTLAAGATILSDPTPVEIPTATTYGVRVIVQSPVASGAWPWNRSVGGAIISGDGFGQGTSAMPAITTIMASTGNAAIFFCDAIIGTIARRQPTILLVGDSICEGYNSAYTSNGNHGFLEIGMFAKYGNYVSIGTGSDTIANFLTLPMVTNRGGLLSVGNFNYAVCEYGTNDLAVGPPTLAVMQARYQAIWARLTARGMKVIQTTITPVTTSTDSWTSAGNQTVSAKEATRVPLNNWLRTVPSPLVGIIDVADMLETSRNSGIWVSPGGVSQAFDGLHPNTAGHALVAANITALNLSGMIY